MAEPKFLTLTVRSVPRIDAEYFAWLRGCFTKLRRRKLLAGVRGGIYAIETTYNRAKGWHVHLHMIIDSPFIDQAAISETWAKITGGSPIVDIRAADRSALDELLKYSAKGSTFVSEPRLVAEYMAAVQGVRQVQAFGSCLDLELDAGEPLDGEAADGAAVMNGRPVVACLGCGGVAWEPIGQCPRELFMAGPWPGLLVIDQSAGVVDLDPG